MTFPNWKCLWASVGNCQQCTLAASVEIHKCQVCVRFHTHFPPLESPVCLVLLGFFTATLTLSESIILVWKGCYQPASSRERCIKTCAVYVASFTHFLFYPTWIWVKVSQTVWQLDIRSLVLSGSRQLWGPTWRMSGPTGAEVEFHVCNYGTTGCRRTIWVRREKQVEAKEKGDEQFIKDFQLNPH